MNTPTPLERTPERALADYYADMEYIEQRYDTDTIEYMQAECAALGAYDRAVERFNAEFET